MTAAASRRNPGVATLVKIAVGLAAIMLMGKACAASGVTFGSGDNGQALVDKVDAECPLPHPPTRAQQAAFDECRAQVMQAAS